jgi:hypothetical protein
MKPTGMSSLFIPFVMHGRAHGSCIMFSNNQYQYQSIRYVSSGQFRGNSHLTRTSIYSSWVGNRWFRQTSRTSELPIWGFGSHEFFWSSMFQSKMLRIHQRGVDPSHRPSLMPSIIDAAAHHAWHSLPSTHAAMPYHVAHHAASHASDFSVLISSPDLVNFAAPI